MIDHNKESDFIFYSSGKGAVNVPIIIGEETVWTTQKNISAIFGVDRTVISKHIRNIFAEMELDEISNVHFLHKGRDTQGIRP